MIYMSSSSTIDSENQGHLFSIPRSEREEFKVGVEIEGNKKMYKTQCISIGVFHRNLQQSAITSPRRECKSKILKDGIHISQRRSHSNEKTYQDSLKAGFLDVQSAVSGMQSLGTCNRRDISH